MSNKTNIYNSGIQGYTIRGKQGLSGNEGYNIYYSIYNINYVEHANTVIELINKTNNNSLGSSLSNDNITYKQNDIIIDCKGRMYIIQLDSSTQNLTLGLIGNIVNQIENNDSNKEIETITAKVLVTGETIVNPYKSLSNTLYDRYFDLYQDTMNVFKLKIENININDTKLLTKFVIIHKCGLSQEYELNEKDYEFVEENNELIIKEYIIRIYDKTASLLPGTTYNIEDDISTKLNYIKDCTMYIDVYTIGNTNSMYRFPINKNDITIDKN